MNDRPTYRKWKRRRRPFKRCERCKHENPGAVRVGGRVIRPKDCVKCGATLTDSWHFPSRSGYQWYVREYLASTGACRDLRVESSEAADELIRLKLQTWTPDARKVGFIDEVVGIAKNLEDGEVGELRALLIEALGGDPRRLGLEPIAWDEAREKDAEDQRQKGRSPAYIDDVLRVTRYFGVITSLTSLADVTMAHVQTYRRTRMAGGWKLDGKTVKAINGRGMNKDLSTLSAFLTRAAANRWIVANPMTEQRHDEKIKVGAVRVDYLPDDDLRLIIATATPMWMQHLITLAYYTGARRGDLLRLEWDRDVDLTGDKGASEKRTGPHCYVRGHKADTPRWMPLHPVAVKALEALRAEPVIDRRVFPVRESTNPASKVSKLFAEACVAAGLVDEDGHNLWTLHDLRRKANTDLRGLGASRKERNALCGHRSDSVNEAYYEALLPDRARTLIDGLPSIILAG